MSKRTDIDLMQDISESIERIISYTQSMDYGYFKRSTAATTGVSSIRPSSCLGLQGMAD